MKKTDTGLREVARTILAQLDETAPMQRLPEIDTEDTTEKLELSDTLDVVSQLRRYRALHAAETGRNADAALAAMNAPRTTRRQFLAQRLERRETRDTDSADVTETADGESFVTDVRRDELTDAGMPARLSEVYQRDARRYDSPFERY